MICETHRTTFLRERYRLRRGDWHGDGLTVPFALAAGISGALTSSHIVVTAGLVKTAAGSIAMGLDGHLIPKFIA